MAKRVIRNDQFLYSFGKKVRELRIEKNLSQYQLSYDTNISRTLIRRIEEGSLNTNISVIPALAKALDISVLELMDFNY